MVQMEVREGFGPPASEIGENEPELKKTWEQVALVLFIAIPFAAAAGAVPVAWGWGLSWRDLIISFGRTQSPGMGSLSGFTDTSPTTRSRRQPGYGRSSRSAG